MMVDHQTERWPLDRLIPYARNARTHSADQVLQIVASIREFGWTSPVLVDEAGEIIAGHGRVLAAGELGLDDVPVIVARGWSEAQVKAYRLADNKLAENAGWDPKLLAVELHDLDAHRFDLALTGFAPDELSALMFPEPPPARELAAPRITYALGFDDAAQQDVWFTFLRQLKERYPDAETIGARLDAAVHYAAG